MIFLPFFSLDFEETGFCTLQPLLVLRVYCLSLYLSFLSFQASTKTSMLAVFCLGSVNIFYALYAAP